MTLDDVVVAFFLAGTAVVAFFFTGTVVELAFFAGGFVVVFFGVRGFFDQVFSAGIGRGFLGGWAGEVKCL